jgi:hypothetical protein
VVASDQWLVTASDFIARLGWPKTKVFGQGSNASRKPLQIKGFLAVFFRGFLVRVSLPSKIVPLLPGPVLSFGPFYVCPLMRTSRTFRYFWP